MLCSFVTSILENIVSEITKRSCQKGSEWRILAEFLIYQYKIPKSFLEIRRKLFSGYYVLTTQTHFAKTILNFIIKERISGENLFLLHKNLCDPLT